MIFEQLRIDRAASRIGASMRGLLRRLEMEGFRRVPGRMPVLLRSQSRLWRYRDPVEWELMQE